MNRKSTWMNDFTEFAQHYNCDLPSHPSLESEIVLWNSYWDQQDYLPSTAQETPRLMGYVLFVEVL